LIWPKPKNKLKPKPKPKHKPKTKPKPYPTISSSNKYIMFRRLVPKELIDALELVLNIDQITSVLTSWILNCLKCKISKRSTVTEFAYPIIKESGVGWISFKFENRAKRRKFLAFDHHVIRIHYERKYFWFEHVEDFFAASAQAKDELLTRVSNILNFVVIKMKFLEFSWKKILVIRVLSLFITSAVILAQIEGGGG
jgi:hypothetical protein